jgi:oligoendopeptidase F
VLAWIATVDAFQHWVYTHEGHTRSERGVAWTDLMRRFGGEVDWSGHTRALEFLWHRQLHIFLYPFYYIEYGIAQLGAIQVWAASKRDRAAALANYKRGLALGGGRTLPELFAGTGCRFDFSREAIAPLVQVLRRELATLPL